MSVAPLVLGGLLASDGFRQFLQSLLQLQRKLLITFLTHRLHVKLHKLVPVRERQRYCKSRVLTVIDLYQEVKVK